MEMYPTTDDKAVEYSEEVIDVMATDDGVDMMIDSEAEELEEAEDDLIMGFGEFEREDELIPDSLVDVESDDTDAIANKENEGE